MTTGSTAEYKPTQVICYTEHRILGKQGELIKPSTGMVKVLPNPVKSGEGLLLELNLPEQQGQLTISIADELGREVYSGSVAYQNQLSLEIPRLLQGKYILTVRGTQTYSVSLIVSE